MTETLPKQKIDTQEKIPPIEITKNKKEPPKLTVSTLKRNSLSPRDTSKTPITPKSPLLKKQEINKQKSTQCEICGEKEATHSCPTCLKNFCILCLKPSHQGDQI